ncbi:hypothetical protein ABH892_003686 [Paenibacillus sp. RC254]
MLFENTGAAIKKSPFSMDCGSTRFAVLAGGVHSQHMESAIFNVMGQASIRCFFCQGFLSFIIGPAEYVN